MKKYICCSTCKNYEAVSDFGGICSVLSLETKKSGDGLIVVYNDVNQDVVEGKVFVKNNFSCCCYNDK